MDKDMKFTVTIHDGEGDQCKRVLSLEIPESRMVERERDLVIEEATARNSRSPAFARARCPRTS